MNPKLSYFATAVIVSVVIFVLALLISTDLKDPQPFWLATLGIILFVHVIGHVFSRRAEKKDRE